MLKKLLAVMLGLIMVLCFAGIASALTVETSFGGEFTLGVYRDNSSMDLSDDGWAGTFGGWFVLDLSAKDKFEGDNSAWVTLHVEPVNWPAQGQGNLLDFSTLAYKLQYGYTHKFSEKLSMNVGDYAGIFRSDGILGSDEDGDAWDDWNKLFDEPGGLLVEFDATPMDGLSVVAAVEPTQQEYLVKAKYEGDGFRIGGDATNADGTNSDWDVWGEFHPFDGVKIIADYANSFGDPRYLLLTEYAVDPFTVKAWFANITGDFGNYIHDTLQTSVRYALTEKFSIEGGFGYDVVNDTGFSMYWAKFYYDKLSLKLTNWVGPECDYGFDIYAEYDVDGTNTVAFWYSPESGAMSLTLEIYLY